MLGSRAFPRGLIQPATGRVLNALVRRVLSSVHHHSTKTRLKGMEAHKVGLLMVQVYLYNVCLA